MFVDVETGFSLTCLREMLTKAEQTAYVKAELCLMEVPNRLDVRGSQNLWDDLQWSHITQTPVVHDVVGITM
jgi:hypothetical protein